MALPGRYDSDNLKPFDNEVLETKLENQLITKLDMNQFVEVDYSLTEAPGMRKVIRTYTGTGNVEDLGMGRGNTEDIGAEFTNKEYDVQVTQGRFPFYDEQLMDDPIAVDKGVQFLSEALTNDITEKTVAELENGTGTIATLDFDGIVDAIAELPNEENNDMYILASKTAYAELQKSSKAFISYVEDFVRTGYVGSIAGVPIYVSKAVKEGEAFLACKSAVKAFVKKGVETEQERDANLRKTTVYARNVRVVACVDATKIAKFGGAGGEEEPEP